MYPLQDSNLQYMDQKSIALSIKLKGHNINYIDIYHTMLPQPNNDNATHMQLGDSPVGYSQLFVVVLTDITILKYLQVTLIWNLHPLSHIYHVQPHYVGLLRIFISTQVSPISVYTIMEIMLVLCDIKLCKKSFIHLQTSRSYNPSQ